MQEYIKLGRKILEEGKHRGDRTGTGTVSIFGTQMRFNLLHGFPLVTTKKVSIKPVIAELLWFLEGSTNNDRLNELGAKIWDLWATGEGELGPIYGAQWRNWVCPDGRVVDQISELIHNLRHNPLSRRHVISAWNPADLPNESDSPQQNALNGKMALAPCHCLFQFYVEEMDLEERDTYAISKGIEINIEQAARDAAEAPTYAFHQRQLDQSNIPTFKLSCRLDQRSADFPVGVPFNIASYSLLTMMIAQCVGMAPGDFIWHGGDTHIYLNQVDNFTEQMGHEPYPLPQMKINPNKRDIFSFTMDDFELQNYRHHPPIRYQLSV